MIFKVAAYNFSAAIQEGKLSVAVFDGEDDGANVSLNRENLKSVLAVDKDKSRAAGSGFYEGLRPSGRNAYSAYMALSQGKRDTVHTDEGDLEVRLLANPKSGNTLIDLFRNGMWITDEIPGLRRADFADRQPFHAVLTLNAQDGGELHRLVRKAEGTMHDALLLKRLNAGERRRLRNALKQIAKAVGDMAPEMPTESYKPDDYLLVDAIRGRRKWRRAQKILVFGSANDYRAARSPAKEAPSRSRPIRPTRQYSRGLRSRPRLRDRLERALRCRLERPPFRTASEGI